MKKIILTIMILGIVATLCALTFSQRDIAAGMAVQLLYDGTQWQQISQSGN